MMNDDDDDIPLGGEGLGRPKEAMLQFALRPSIIGLASKHALVAAAGSRNVTYLNIILWSTLLLDKKTHQNQPIWTLWSTLFFGSAGVGCFMPREVKTAMLKKLTYPMMYILKTA